MTFEERMAELGVDLSDLPNNKHAGMPYPVSRYESLLKQAADFTGFDAPAGFEIFNVLQYALHLVDVIDRMETRIVNLTVELDWLRYDECPTCVNHDKHNPLLCEIDDDWVRDKDGYCTHYVYSGVPEDWRVDDG